MDKQKEILGSQHLPENGESIQPEAEQFSNVDKKIKELEIELDRFKKLKEDERTERLNELREIQAREEIPDQYKKLEEKQKVSTVPAGRAKSELEQLSSSLLLNMTPEDAVASLVALAVGQSDGFEKALGLVKDVAKKQGGAWILDQFHLRMTENK